jgi:hypothetical protein
MTRKTLKISEDTYRHLESLKRSGETWDGLLQRLGEVGDWSPEKTPSCTRCHAYLADWVEIGDDNYCRDCAKKVDSSTRETPVKPESTFRSPNQAEVSTQGRTVEDYGGLREDTVRMADDDTQITRWPLSLEQKWWGFVEELDRRRWFTKSRTSFGTGNDDRARERYFRSPPEMQRKHNHMTPVEFLAYIIRASNPERPPYWRYSIESLRRDGWPEEVLEEVKALLKPPSNLDQNLAWLLTPESE